MRTSREIDVGQWQVDQEEYLPADDRNEYATTYRVLTRRTANHSQLDHSRRSHAERRLAPNSLKPLTRRLTR